MTRGTYLCCLLDVSPLADLSSRACSPAQRPRPADGLILRQDGDRRRHGRVCRPEEHDAQPAGDAFGRRHRRFVGVTQVQLEIASDLVTCRRPDTQAIGAFVVTIHYGEDLSAQDRNGQSDPYIVSVAAAVLCRFVTHGLTSVGLLAASPTPNLASRSTRPASSLAISTVRHS